MAWTAPRTWTSGELVTALMMNTHVRDQMNFLRSTAQLSQTFRGLVLRSSPNADRVGIVVSEVNLVKCDELITDLGTRVNPRPNLTCDIAAAVGAGGIDAGAKAVSAWYSIHYLFKGPTAAAPDSPQGPSADALIAHREKNFLKDQQQVTGGGDANIRDAAARTAIAQGFKTANTGKVEFIDVQVKKFGAPAGRVWLEIRADNAGVPAATVLATSDKLDASKLTAHASPYGLIRFVFRAPATLTATTQYHFAVMSDVAISGANYIECSYGNAVGYANGSYSAWDGATWTASAAFDLVFYVFVTQNDTALALPAGYTEKCLLGYAYNNAGNALVPFFAVNKSVRQFVANFVSGVASAVPTLADVSFCLPPVPLSGVILEVNSTVALDTVLASGVPDGYAGTGNLGYSAVIISTASQTLLLNPLNTEYQALYWQRYLGSGLLSLWIEGYQW